MLVPKIIHQTWKDISVPSELEKLAHTWKENHPDWTYILWTDEMNRDFIKDHFPDFLQKYDAYPFNIQRVDAVRYLTLYKMGGVYIDLDFECLKNIEGLLQDEQCVLGCEPKAHCVLHNKDYIISNAFMATVSDSLFYKLIIEGLYAQPPVSRHNFNTILESTGPFMLSNVYKAFSDKDQVSLKDDSLLYPLTKSEIDSIVADPAKKEMFFPRLKDAYAIHWYHGTWWK